MASNSTNLLSSPTQSKPLKTPSQLALVGCSNLIRLLPSGTVFLFQFLSPVVTNNGECHAVHKYLSIILIVLCGLSCFLTSFTDSFVDAQGSVHYGIVTTKGLWPNSTEQDLSSYKLQVGDFVHALVASSVFVVMALLNGDVVECFYPGFKSTQKALLMALPLAIGVASGSVFVIFPSTRYGIGRPRGENSLLASTTSA